MSRAGKSSKPKAKKKAPPKKTVTRQAAAKKPAPRKAASKAGASKRATMKKLQLAEVLDLTAAAPLAKSLLSSRGSEIDIDASRVKRVGAQCLQVLIAAEATWNADGKSFQVVKPSEEFLDGSRLLGIQIEGTAREQA